MKEKINSIDMNGKLNHEELYNLFKTYSFKRNKEISEKINNFKNNMDFFKFYSNKDIKNLLYIFELEISENDESFSSFKSYIERYIYCSISDLNDEKNSSLFSDSLNLKIFNKFLISLFE